MKSKPVNKLTEVLRLKKAAIDVLDKGKTGDFVTVCITKKTWTVRVYNFEDEVAVYKGKRRSSITRG